MTTATKTVKLVNIKHRCYAYNVATSEDSNSDYSRSTRRMYNTCVGLVSDLRKKYAKYTYAKEISFSHHCDSDDDAFERVIISVPEADVPMVQRKLRNATGEGGRGWTLDCDAEICGSREVEFTAHSGRLTPGKLLYLCNTDVDSIRINGVDNYAYGWKNHPDPYHRNETVFGPTKECYINNSGVSTKLLVALARYGFDAKLVKSKLPVDAKKTERCHYISVEMSEKNRANIMKLARTNPTVLDFRNRNGHVEIPNEHKSDFVKAYYAAKDKAAKAETK